MTRVARWFLWIEAAAFGAAALLHTGVFGGGHLHGKAATAETVIGLVLVAGLLATFMAPQRSRGIALGVQGFALLGTIVGLITIAIGVGPRTALDLMMHAGFVATLVLGMVRVAGRNRAVPAS